MELLVNLKKINKLGVAPLKLQLKKSSAVLG